MTELVPFAISVAQAVKACSLGRSSIYAAIAAGKLKTRKAGRRTLIETAELRRFLGALPITGEANPSA